MADAIVSSVAEQLIGLLAEQARFHINLVRGAEKEVHQLADELNRIRYLLDDAENQRFKKEAVDNWLSRLEQTSHEMEDVLDEWKYAILKLEIEQHRSDDDHVVVAPKKKLVSSFIPSSSCLCFKKVVVRHDIAKKILNVKAKLDQVLKDKNKYSFDSSQPTSGITHKSRQDLSTSSTKLVDVEVQHFDRDVLVTKLMGRREELGSLQTLSVVGVGGLGKTTLAQLIYNDNRVEEFFDLKIWVCVSNPFNLAAIAKGIIESVKKVKSPNSDDTEILLRSVEDSISGKRFLLILDDVWTEDSNKWDPLETSLKCGGAGSKILVTTRNEKVAKITGAMDEDIHRPGKLSHDDCWLLLHSIALSGRYNVKFEDIGKKIAEKCKGLPLALKTLGSLLRFKNTLEEWESVLESEIWQLKEAKIDIFPHLLLSYNELSQTLKRCFSYCAVYPKDSKINVESLIRNWMALGYLGSDIGNMELKGQECFDILAMSSLFQNFEKDDLSEKIKSCMMHDIVHDFAQFIRKSGKVEATPMNKTSCQACDHLQVFSANEFYTLFLDCSESPLNLCDCLKRLRVLDLRKPSLESIPQGIENMIHLRMLNLDGMEQLSPAALKIIFQLYNLQTLSLIDCNLEEIPREFGNLINLRHLNLSGNSNLKELSKEIGNLVQLRHLSLSKNKSLKELPKEIGNLVQLRDLIVSENESMKELPKEIGNLSHLNHLDLSDNDSLEKLPEEIGNLIQLRHLKLSWNKSLKELPESIGSLHALQTLNVSYCDILHKIPQGLGELRGLQTLGEFHGGSGRSKLGLLKNLNHLSGSLMLKIRLAKDDLEHIVEDARQAELRNKRDMNELVIRFEDAMDENEELSLVWMDVMDALQPPPNLTSLNVEYYKGQRLPLSWIESPLNQLRQITMHSCNLSSLPPLGKLPCLEQITMKRIYGLQFVGREFLGLTTTVERDIVVFPRLKQLTFNRCLSWKEWEDITSEEEECAGMTFMPRLANLEITDCLSLKALPFGLLRKVSSLEELNFSNSISLRQHYMNGDGSDWKSITKSNPSLRLFGGRQHGIRILRMSPN